MAHESPHKVLEDAGVAYDPGGQHLDLTKDEKRRTTALMLAIQAYKDFIIKEAAYLREMADLARRDEAPKLQSATVEAIVEMASKFDEFIESGTMTRTYGAVAQKESEETGDDTETSD